MTSSSAKTPQSAPYCRITMGASTSGVVEDYCYTSNAPGLATESQQRMSVASILVDENHDPNPLCEIASPSQRPRRLSWVGAEDTEAPSPVGQVQHIKGHSGPSKARAFRDTMQRLEKQLRGHEKENLGWLLEHVRCCIAEASEARQSNETRTQELISTLTQLELRHKALEGRLSTSLQEEENLANVVVDLARTNAHLQKVVAEKGHLEQQIKHMHTEMDALKLECAKRLETSINKAPESLSKSSPEFLAMLERLEMLEEDADMKEAQVHQLVQQRDELQQHLRDSELQVQMSKAVLLDVVKAGDGHRVPPESTSDETVVQDTPCGDSTLMQLVSEFTTLHVALKDRYLEEWRQRRKLHNEVVDLKGAIRVFCRIRPVLLDTGDTQQALCVHHESQDNQIVVTTDRATTIFREGRAGNTQRVQRFTFDAVYGPQSSQDAIYRDASPVITSVMDGYNVCMFAYGQTGSGKTYTMEGIETDRGINYRTLEELFRIVTQRQPEASYSINVSMIEVYMENIRDLLSSGPVEEAVKLEVRQGTQGSYLPGLTELKVRSTDEAYTILRRGAEARKCAVTSMNETSSRSHCMLCVRVRGRSKITGDIWHAKLWLVDLAGSERLGKTEVDGQQLKEAQFINKSLSALGDCIHGLCTKSSHIPFRNSKLTYVLQDSLSGDSKTLMFVTVTPTEVNSSETICSLNFGARVRGLTLGPAKRHIEAGGEVAQLRSELSSLRNQVKMLEQEKQALNRRAVTAEAARARAAVQAASRFVQTPKAGQIQAFRPSWNEHQCPPSSEGLTTLRRSWNKSNAIAASSRPTPYSPTKKGMVKKVATSSRLPKTASRLTDVPQTSDDTTGAETVTYQLTPARACLKAAPATDPGGRLTKKAGAVSRLHMKETVATSSHRAGSRLKFGTSSGPAMHNEGHVPHAKPSVETPKRAADFGNEKTSGTKLARIHIPPLDIAAALSLNRAGSRPEMDRLPLETEASKPGTCNPVPNGADSAPMVQASEGNSTVCSSSCPPKDMLEVSSMPTENPKAEYLVKFENYIANAKDSSITGSPARYASNSAAIGVPASRVQAKVCKKL
eukprot:jgi/Botrbrau1/983/Bobra.114_1s0023.1